MPYPEADKIAELISKAETIVIMQADNPDGDSLGSALALEQILGNMGKKPLLYSGVAVPEYLKHFPGWDRVQQDLPTQFDLSIIVDTSADSLFGILNASGQRAWVASKPCIVLDHHKTEATITYATVMCNYPVVATGELLYELALQLDWPLSTETCQLLASSILSDSLGLMSEGTSARSLHVMAELVERGVSLAALENLRRDYNRKSARILAYKGRLLERVEYNDKVASITIPWPEIEEFSHEYNPSVLALDEMRQVIGIAVAVAFKVYPDGKITGKIRCNYGFAIADKLAEHFGGGGHKYASGFKIQDGRPLDQIKTDCLNYANEMLNETI